jgi:hypothetical protein
MECSEALVGELWNIGREESEISFHNVIVRIKEM